jgi:hypothetical protein
MKKNNTTFADYLRNALRRLNTKPLYLTAVALLGLSTLGIAQTVPAYVPTDGLVGWWPFNGNANDESGNGNNGTGNGATLSADRYGNANSAYNFNGINSSIQCVSAGPTGNPNMSVCFWLKTSQATVGQIFGYGSNASSGNDFRIYINGQCSPAIFFDTYDNAIAQSTTFNGNWDFYTVIYNGTLGSNVNSASIYKNGQLISNVCFNVNISQTNISGNIPITFGRYHGTAQSIYYNGDLDDIGVWNRALTQQEITALYNANNCNNLTVSATTAQPTCGLPNGTLTGSATGGNGTYAYLWSNGATTATVANLSAGTYTVTVTSAAGCTASSSATVNNSSCPKVTTQSTVNNITQNAATVSWPAVPCAAKYRVVVKNVSTGVQTTTIVSAPNTSLNLSSLQPNTTYQVRIRTQCSQNGTVVSQLSPIRSFTTLNNQGIQCLPPTVSGITLSNTSVTINWTPALGAIQYNLRYRPAGTSTWVVVIIGNGISNSTTLQNLAPATAYEFQIRTKCNDNPEEFSPYSGVLTFTTLPLRLSEGDKQLNTLLYPNPTNSNINVVISATSETQTTIRITDLLGRVLLNETEELLSGNNTITYNIGEYAAGVYLVHVGNGNTQQVFKVVKE